MANICFIWLRVSAFSCRGRLIQSLKYPQPWYLQTGYNKSSYLCVYRVNRKLSLEGQEWTGWEVIFAAQCLTSSYVSLFLTAHWAIVTDGIRNMRMISLSTSCFTNKPQKNKTKHEEIEAYTMLSLQPNEWNLGAIIFLCPCQVGLEYYTLLSAFRPPLHTSWWASLPDVSGMSADQLCPQKRHKQTKFLAGDLEQYGENWGKSKIFQNILLLRCFKHKLFQ